MYLCIHVSMYLCIYVTMVNAYADVRTYARGGRARAGDAGA